MIEEIDHCYRVSEVTGEIRGMLEARFNDIRVEGEISNFRPSSTGHLYFTLKDDDSMLSAVMFRGRISRLTFDPADGQLVIARGNISVYAKRGTYQIICEALELAGEGNILAMLERRKRSLAAEGLFDSEKKQELPPFPSKVAVITSPTGAALKDIFRVLKRRNAGIDLVVLPAPVQGDEAAARIATQIRVANRHNLADVLIVGRGGGALEDLLPFSEEVVVRAVAESAIPVISAVGHEIDTALSDLAADVCAPTPSAAAEMVSSQQQEVAGRIERALQAMIRALGTKTERVRLLLDRFSPEALERNFRILIQPYLLRLDDAKEESLRAMQNATTAARHRVELAMRGIEAASPMGILEKGYSVVTESKSGKAVRSAEVLSRGDTIDIRFARGKAGALVEEVTNEGI